MKKRFLSVVLCLCMVAGILPALALPAAAYSTGDTYPSEYKSAAADSVIDRWNFYNRECTSFVAWCLNDRNGVGFTNWYGGVRWGNANNWGYAARSLGITVDSTPAVGAVAWWDGGTYGHVAWVSAVNGDSVTIEEYNYNYSYAYHTRTISKNSPSGYIHIKDINIVSYPTDAKNLGENFYACIYNPRTSCNLENRDDNVQTAAANSSDPRQIWHFIHLGDGSYNIINTYDGRYLDVYNGGGSGTNVWACTGNGDTPQKWKIVDDAYGMSGAYNLLISYNDGLALDVAYPAAGAGANLQVWNRNTESLAQTFQINRIDNIGSINGYDVGTDFYAQISYKGYYFEASGVITEDGHNMDIQLTAASKPTDPKQLWYFHRESSGAYTITNAYNGWYMDVPGANAYNKARVRLWCDDPNNTLPGRRWYILHSPGDPAYRIVSSIGWPDTLYAIDIPGGNAYEGAATEIYRQSESDWQYFEITERNYNPAPQPLTVRTPPTASAITYGQTLMDSRITGGVVVDQNGNTVSGSWIWTAASTQPDASGNFEALFSADEASKYELTSASVAVTVTKENLQMTAPTAAAIDYGQKLSSSVLTGGLATDPSGNPVVGTWVWQTPDVIPASGTYQAVFTPSDSKRYNQPDAVNVPVAVNPTVPELTISVSASQSAGTEATVNVAVKNPYSQDLTDTPAPVLICQIGTGTPQTIANGRFTIPAGTAEGTIIAVTASTSANDRYQAAAKTVYITVAALQGGAASGLSNFKDVSVYYDGLFRDVPANEWYTENVASAVQLGLMNGTGGGTFSPFNNLTLGEAVALAARLHSIYYNGTQFFPSYDGGNWYDPYVNYIKGNGLLSENYNYDRPATREEFVHILAQVLPKEALESVKDEISFADAGSIIYQADVSLLSRAGVINGILIDGISYFKPNNTITRAEVAAIITRMAKVELRTR